MKRAMISLGLIGALVLATALSGLPQLHEQVHADANQPQHECAVTLIAHGKCDNVLSAPVIEPAIVPISSEQVSTSDFVFVAPQFLSGRIFEHAPPANS